MRHGDTTEEHKRKVEKKLRELHAKNWSEARIKQYMKDWGMFTVWSNEAINGKR